MRSKLLVGQSPWLEMAADDWALAQPDTALNLLPIGLNKHYGYDLGNLRSYSPADTTAFVAWGPEFLNFQRLELMGELKKRGFKMPPLLHPNAVISPSAQFQENAWVQAQSVIGPQVKVGMNACIGMAVRVGAFSQLGKSVWIGAGASLGSWVRVDANAFIAQQMEVADSVSIGRQAQIEVMQRIERDWPEKAFHIHASGLRGNIVELN